MTECYLVLQSDRRPQYQGLWEVSFSVYSFSKENHSANIAEFLWQI